MAVRHLTDDEIQEFLDNTSTPTLAVHVQNCAACKEQIQRYKNLYASLKKETGFSLPPAFAQMVIDRIKHASEEAFSVRVLPLLMAFVGLMFGLGATIYFVGFEKLAANWKEFSVLEKYFNPQVFSFLSNFISRLHLDFGLLGSAVFIIMIMIMIDHFILRSKERLISFFR
jgi:hypothetical protein